MGVWLIRHAAGRVRRTLMNVPTYHTTRRSPATAENQLDYVFASRGFHHVRYMLKRNERR